MKEAYSLLERLSQHPYMTLHFGCGEWRFETKQDCKCKEAFYDHVSSIIYNGKTEDTLICEFLQANEGATLRRSQQFAPKWEISLEGLWEQEIKFPDGMHKQEGTLMCKDKQIAKFRGMES